MNRSLAAIIIALQLFVLAGCGLFSNTGDPRKSWSVEQYYEAALEELNDGNYEAAIKSFEALEARYPYGRYAQEAQLQIAYTRYKQKNVPETIAACDRFIKQYPTSSAVDYAYYLKGLANFNQDLGLFGFLADNDLSDRDPKAAYESFDSFKELVTRFPESRYAPDSIARMDYLTNSLALHEVHVARYYMRRGAALAAANRAQQTVTTYPRAPATEEALAIMVQAYDRLGLPQLRDDAARVMQKNFPESRYLAKSNNYGERPWWKWW
ncbi:MAG: outer membrane protein assembly factor BamD [Pseudomonadota bacterium]